MAIKNKIELTRVNTNLPTILVERVQEYANSMGINFTNACIVLLNNALNYQKSLDNLPLLINAVEQLKGLSNKEDLENWFLVISIFLFNS